MRKQPFYCEATKHIVTDVFDRYEQRIEFVRSGGSRLSGSTAVVVRRLCGEHARLVYRELERKARPQPEKRWEDVPLFAEQPL